jgi:heme-degrading monooxygenase HmoA
MFSVLFEVHPKTDQWDNYLGNAKMLRPELEKIDGFIDNIRYRSLTRPGWILSLSGWRDEKAVVRWRTTQNHHATQEKGRNEIFSDYRLRVGQITQDTQVPAGQVIQEQRLDETQIGEATTVTLTDTQESADSVKRSIPEEVAILLGLDKNAPGLVAWDVYDAVLTPGNVILMISWKNAAATKQFERSINSSEGVRFRQIRVVRDYGMFDRREAPQYYPDAKRE